MKSQVALYNYNSELGGYIILQMLNCFKGKTGVPGEPPSLPAWRLGTSGGSGAGWPAHSHKQPQWPLEPSPPGPTRTQVQQLRHQQPRRPPARHRQQWPPSTGGGSVISAPAPVEGGGVPAHAVSSAAGSAPREPLSSASSTSLRDASSTL